MNTCNRKRLDSKNRAINKSELKKEHTRVIDKFENFLNIRRSIKRRLTKLLPHAAISIEDILTTLHTCDFICMSFL